MNSCTRLLKFIVESVDTGSAKATAHAHAAPLL